MKSALNLYLYLPKIELAPFASARIWLLYGILIGLLVVTYGTTYLQAYVLGKKNTVLEKTYKERSDALDKAKAIAEKTQTQTLVREIAAIKNLIREKKEILGIVPLAEASNLDELNAQLRVLSTLNFHQIQITSMSYTDTAKNIQFAGLTSDALSVLEFIRKLKASPTYKGVYFSVIKLDKSAEKPGLLTFAISSTQSETNAPAPTQP